MVVFSLLFPVIAASSPAKQKRKALSFLVDFHLVGDQECRPAANRAWLDKTVQTTNRIFVDTKVRFSVGGVSSVCGRELGLADGEVMTRKDRHRLSKIEDATTIDVFVVHHLEDVDIEDRALRGVHWRSRRGKEKVHYVILSKIAAPRVLAHELGHYFGNSHSKVHGNVMSYSQGKELPVFSRRQIHRIRREAAREKKEQNAARKAKKKK